MSLSTLVFNALARLDKHYEKLRLKVAGWQDELISFYQSTNDDYQSMVKSLESMTATAEALRVELKDADAEIVGLRARISILEGKLGVSEERS